MFKRPRLVALSAVLLLASLHGPAHAAPRRDERVYAAVVAHRPQALALLQSIVDIDSGTGDVAGGRKVETLLTQELEALGAQVRTEAAEAADLPDNLVAVLKGTGKAKILIIAHIDTVFGPNTVSGRPFSIKGDRAFGPGVGDEKAGVVNAVTALKILHELKFNNYASLTLLIDDSEERGSPGSTRLIKALARQSDVELNMEPGDQPDAITVWRKGSSSVRIVVKGRAAHAGMAPQLGRNAADELVHQLNQLQGVFPHAGDGITVNVTLIKAGDRNNIIPADAEATLNIRYRTVADFDGVLAKIKSNAATTVIPETTVTVVNDAAFPPLTENPQIDRLAAQAQSIYGELGKTLELSGNGGASESALAMAEGAPALDGLGYVGADFHTDHEWIDLTSVTPRLYLFTRLIMETAAHPPTRASAR